MYKCNNCDATFVKWSGQCSSCKAWNSIEVTVHSDAKAITPKPLSEIKINTLNTKFTSFSPEFDRVLGGGIIPGMACLIGGDPGIGKSTLLSQIGISVGGTSAVLYVSGEESFEQIALRIKRLNLQSNNMEILSTNNLNDIFLALAKKPYAVLVVDSIQTIASNEVSGINGSVNQVRHCAHALIAKIKSLNVATFIIGHVTKDGNIAGPRVLEHMVDTVLYFENELSNRFRILRVYKNRYGATGELGIFAMQKNGLQPVTNPSRIFLSEYNQNASGSAIVPIFHGSRTIAIEIQALAESENSYKKQTSIGYDNNRLAMLIAVIEKFTKLKFGNVYINVVGGVKITETAADLGVCFAMISSILNKTLAKKTFFLGEVGLSGEIRPVPNGVDRIAAVEKIGFERVILPKGNVYKQLKNSGLEVHAIENIKQLVDLD